MGQFMPDNLLSLELIEQAASADLVSMDAATLKKLGWSDDLISCPPANFAG